MTTPTNSTSQAQRSRRWFWIALGALILAMLVFGRGAGLLFGGQADPGPPVSGVTTVTVDDNFFAPAAIQIPAETTVTWIWEGNNDHNIVGDGFESPVQTQGQFAHTFTTPGTYAYRCTLHGSMRGEVIVAEGGL